MRNSLLYIRKRILFTN